MLLTERKLLGSFLSCITHKNLEQRSICLVAEYSAHDAPLQPAAPSPSPPSEGKLLGKYDKKLWLQKKMQVSQENSQSPQPCPGFHGISASGKKMEPVAKNFRESEG